MNNMDHPSRCHAREIKLPNQLTRFFLTSQVGINVLIEMSCRHQLLQMSFQHVAIFDHVAYVFVVSTKEFLVPQGRVFEQF